MKNKFYKKADYYNTFFTRELFNTLNYLLNLNKKKCNTQFNKLEFKNIDDNFCVSHILKNIIIIDYQ